MIIEIDMGNRYDPEYYLLHKDEICEYRKRYYQENKDKVNLSHKRYCDKNRDKLNKHRQNYDRKRKEDGYWDRKCDEIFESYLKKWEDEDIKS